MFQLRLALESVANFKYMNPGVAIVAVIFTDMDWIQDLRIFFLPFFSCL